MVGRGQAGLIIEQHLFWLYLYVLTMVPGGREEGNYGKNGEVTGEEGCRDKTRQEERGEGDTILTVLNTVFGRTKICDRRGDATSRKLFILVETSAELETSRNWN